MRGTFLLFLHGEEQQESRAQEVNHWLHDIVGIGPQGDSGGWVVSPFTQPAPSNWPEPYRMLAERLDPALVIRAVRSTQFEHPVHLMYRTGDEKTWSFLTLNWERPTDEGGFPL